MAFKGAVLAMRVLEIMLFTGLLGCAVTVALSWISVVKGCFTDTK